MLTKNRKAESQVARAPGPHGKSGDDTKGFGRHHRLAHAAQDAAHGEHHALREAAEMVHDLLFLYFLVCHGLVSARIKYCILSWQVYCISRRIPLFFRCSCYADVA